MLLCQQFIHPCLFGPFYSPLSLIIFVWLLPIVSATTPMLLALTLAADLAASQPFSTVPTIPTGFLYSVPLTLGPRLSLSVSIDVSTTVVVSPVPIFPIYVFVCTLGYFSINYLCHNAALRGFPEPVALSQRPSAPEPADADNLPRAQFIAHLRERPACRDA